jgi:methyl-accepting chemotaxis protein
MNTTQRLLLATLGPVLGLLLLSLLTFFNQRELNRSQANRHASLQLAQELRHSSDELTRLARTYAVTGDEEYERQFWRVLDVRNGKQPRPDGRTVPLRTLMIDQGFTAAELAKLQEAEDNSNALVSTENVAMNAMKGRFDDGKGGFTKLGSPDPDMAQRIMHDRKYHTDKALIMGPIGEFESMLDERTEEATVRFRRWGDILALLGVLLTAVSLATVWNATRRHAASLRRAIGDLSASSEHVARGAEQVAASSRHLAQGATEQVTALEEIAASAKTTGAGATDNVRRTASAADLLDREEREFAGATALVGEMARAIEEIDEAGGRISKINKLVDEIAFQTNILALNAAVEAARAGEAGQGFAVVADEVRRLAQRCSAAAGETAGLIDEAIARTGVGREKMHRLSDSIASLAAVARDVREIMDQVRDGSRLQHDAVARIGSAIGQIEQVTHHAAAGAEEGSVAAEEMNAQAVALREIVAELQKMVGGAGQG